MKVYPAPIPSWQFSFIEASDFAPYFCRAQQQSHGEHKTGPGFRRGRRRCLCGRLSCVRVQRGGAPAKRRPVTSVLLLPRFFAPCDDLLLVTRHLSLVTRNRLVAAPPCCAIPLRCTLSPPAVWNESRIRVDSPGRDRNRFQCENAQRPSRTKDIPCSESDGNGSRRDNSR